MRYTFICAISLIVAALYFTPLASGPRFSLVVIPVLVGFSGAVIGARICLQDARREQFLQFRATLHALLSSIQQNVVNTATDEAREENKKIEFMRLTLASLGHFKAAAVVYDIFLDIRGKIHLCEDDFKAGRAPHLILPEVASELRAKIDSIEPNVSVFWK